MKKPVKGTVELNAYHDSGSIVIEVADDGKGLDKEQLQTAAIEKGLIPPGHVLTDEEADKLIFEPGLSVASQALAETRQKHRRPARHHRSGNDV